MLVFYGVQEESFARANDQLVNAEEDFNLGSRSAHGTCTILDKNKSKEHPGWIEKGHKLEVDAEFEAPGRLV